MKPISAKIIFIILGTLLFNSCTDESAVHTVPWAEVDFQFDIVNQDAKLNTGGEHLIFDTRRLATDRCGYSGLIVYNTGMMDNGVWMFYAFDRCCPKEKRKDIKVNVQSDGVKVVCPECKTIYDLFSGGLRVDGVGTENLQRYKVQIRSGNGKFRVTR